MSVRSCSFAEVITERILTNLEPFAVNQHIASRADEFADLSGDELSGRRFGAARFRRIASEQSDVVSNRRAEPQIDLQSEAYRHQRF